MELTIFGGTGGVGRHLTTQALEAGHRVTLFARNPAGLPAEGVKVIRGELSDRRLIDEATASAGAVLSALGPRKNTAEDAALLVAAMENIIGAMSSQGVKRLVVISGAGVLLPGDQVTAGRRVVRALIKLFSKHVLLAKEREAELIRSSQLEWVLVRPPRIAPGPATGRYRVFPDRVPSPSISQGDVADLMLKCATTPDWVRQAPIPGY